MSAAFDPNVPFSQEAEESVIGSVIINPGIFASLITFLRAEDFFLLRHNRIWQAFLRLHLRGDVIDYLTTAEELKGMGVLDEIGGYPYLIQIMNSTPTSVHGEYYARIVQRIAIRRNMLEAADKMRELAFDENIGIDEVLARGEMAYHNVMERSETSEVVSMADAMIEMDNTIVERATLYKKNPNYILGVRTGLAPLDTLLDGLHPGITTLGAGTGMGKTALSLTIALNASRAGWFHETLRPAHVHIFSGEMTQEQMNMRLMAIESGIDTQRLSRGAMRDEEFTKYMAAQESLLKTKLSFESGKRMNVLQIRNRVRQMVNAGQMDMFVIDGLLQIEALKVDMHSGKQQRRYQEEKRRDALEFILNELEDIAMTHKVRFFMTHQLSRNPAARQDKRPVVSDLAEASFVEQKSAVILMLYRESYYDPSVNEIEAECIVRKNRHGTIGTVRLAYEAKHTKFTTWQPFNEPF